MSKTLKRGLRRQARARMIARVHRVYPHVAVPEKLADNLQHCSGPCCGNPRRHWREPTIQERRAGLTCTG